ncbi:hypothetical protein [Moorena sp. SIO4G3]|uniref:hypothetical protein n=1 Tax=Moorena sp. SIO4G3 TaxID=2607821 RepID=UPI00142B3285|nr:hypothetical protein [Moorena sp. SIO4G3]NEO78091.1 hypothetical protein [Moorena sp. SIO4G3]
MVRSPHCNLGQRPRYANDERVGVCHLTCKHSGISGQRSALWNRLPACEASVSGQLLTDS